MNCNYQEHLGIDPWDLNYLSSNNCDDKILRAAISKIAPLNTDKSFLLTALIPTKDLAVIDKAFKQIANLITQVDFTHNWQARQFVTTLPDERFSMLNVFLTNNIQPQLIFLGADVIRYLVKDFYLVDQDNYLFDDKGLLTPLLLKLMPLTYLWPENLENNISFKQVEFLTDSAAGQKELAKVFKTVLQTKLLTDLVTFKAVLPQNQLASQNSPDYNSSLREFINKLKTITILNLDWLIREIRTRDNQAYQVLSKEQFKAQPIGQTIITRFLTQMSK